MGMITESKNNYMSAKGMRVDGDVNITENKERRVVVGNGVAQVELVGAARL